MRILLLGKNGQAGWELQRTLALLGEVIAADYPEIDLAKADDTRSLVRECKPQVIVNAAAYTNVDKAESETDLAFAINATAPRILAEEAKRINALLVHYSTDYVFDGARSSPYTEEDPPNPLNAYAKSKLAGEQAIQSVDGAYLLLRTSWVYSLRRDSFVTKVLKWSREHQTLRIVDDQTGSPTCSRMLAEVTAQMLGMSRGNVSWLMERKGLYHLAGNGAATRHEWAQAILRHDPRAHEQITKEILPVKTSDFPSPAARPVNSALNCERFCAIFGIQLPNWESALDLAMQGEN